MTVFVDTGVLFAAADRRDEVHGQAADILGELAQRSTVTTDHVVVETWVLLNARYGRYHAMRFWRGLRLTPLRIESVTPSDLERALAIADGWEDQNFDIVDCTSFAVMERLGVREAATFDSDFAVYRFGADRREAFVVIS